MTSALPPAMLDSVRQMNGTRRFLVLGGLVAALALIFGLTRYAQAPAFVTLYRGLELQEAAGMTDALQQAGLRYQLVGGGSEILVPSEDLARARVAIAKEGIRAGGGSPGNELLDGSNLVRTDRELALLERRALEGELARTIRQLHGVDRAVVHLGLPESSPLRKLERPAKASVVVALRGGRRLSTEEVTSIAYLVANAVPRLDIAQVAVLDAEMRLLSAPEDGSGGGLTSRQLEQQRAVEQDLQAKAEGMLATVLGPGEARVQVSARLDFEQRDRTVERYDPDGAVLQNEQRSEVTAADSLEGGNGTVVNNTYQNSRTVERVAGPVGAIDRLTVAVLLNERALERVAGAGVDRARELVRYEQVVRDAIGLDSARGDRVTLVALPFENVLGTVDSAGAGGDGGTRVLMVAERFSRPLVGLIGILAAVILALRLLRPPAGALAVSGAMRGTGAMPAGTAEPEVVLPPVQVPALNAVATRLKSEVQNESAQRPETAASVVKAWLGEGAA